MVAFEMDAVLAVVREASELGRTLQGNVRAELKPDNTFVTEADLAIETLLRDRLSTLTPGWSFLGEEEGLTGDPEAPAWIIDPIDGTNNFVRDLPIWTISLGAVANGEVIGGIVSAPVLGELSWASKGNGAWRESNGKVQQLQARDRDELIQEDIIAYNTEVESAVDFSQVNICMRNLGSVAYHLALLGRGALAAALARRHKLYDVAGGMAICLEAGYEAQYLDGRAWAPDLTSPKEEIPLLVAPPKTMKLLTDALELRHSATVLAGHADTPARS